MKKTFKTLLAGAALALGSLSSLTAIAADPIKIGSILSVTGPAAFLGDPELKTLQLYVEDINKKGEAYNDARRYFSSKDDYYLYSFLSICYHLDLCPKTIQTIIGLTPESVARNRQVDVPMETEEKAAA